MVQVLSVVVGDLTVFDELRLHDVRLEGEFVLPEAAGVDDRTFILENEQTWKTRFKICVFLECVEIWIKMYISGKHFVETSLLASSLKLPNSNIAK